MMPSNKADFQCVCLTWIFSLLEVKPKCYLLLQTEGEKKLIGTI
jgi:hypothetical protein